MDQEFIEASIRLQHNIISCNLLKKFLKVCPNSDCTIFKSASGKHFLFQIECDDVDWERTFDFEYFIDNTRQKVLDDNKITKFIKLAKISPEEIEEFINCYKKHELL